MLSEIICAAIVFETWSFQFKRSLCHFAAKHDLLEVVDFMHALLGSCQAANYPLPGTVALSHVKKPLFFVFSKPLKSSKQVLDGKIQDSEVQCNVREYILSYYV